MAQNNEPRPIKKGENPKRYVMQNFEELKFVENIKCKQRGSLRLFRFHPFSKYMASKLVCSVPAQSMSPVQATQLVKQYQDRCRIKQPHIIYSIASESQNITRNTSLGQIELFQIYLFFEFMQLTLHQLTEKRKIYSINIIYIILFHQEFLLPESEAWCLVRGVVSALLFLQQNDIPHGMLSLHNIYFDEEYLLYRVYDQELISGRWGNWLKCQNYQKGKPEKDFSEKEYQEIFHILSPECKDLLDLDQILMEEQVDPFKSDVYTFGYVILQSLSFNQGLSLNEMIKWVSYFYSPELVRLLQMCTENDLFKRPDWNMIQEYIQKLPADLLNASQKPQNNVQIQQQQIQNPTKAISDNVNQSPIKQENLSQSLKSQPQQNLQKDFKSLPTEQEQKQEDNIDLKLMQLNQKIEETLAKSFIKTKSIRQ